MYQIPLWLCSTAISILLTWVNRSVYMKNYLEVVVTSDSDLKLISLSWNGWSISLVTSTETPNSIFDKFKMPAQIFVWPWRGFICSFVLKVMCLFCQRTWIHLSIYIWRGQSVQIFVIWIYDINFSLILNLWDRIVLLTGTPNTILMLSVANTKE